MATQTKNNYKLTEAQKADILARVANGESRAALAREHGVTTSSITQLANRNEVTLVAVKEDLIERRKRIIDKGLLLIEKKVERALNKQKEEQDDNLRIDHVSNVVDNMWKQNQVENNQPTDITTNITNLSEYKVLLQGKLENLSNPTLLFQTMYDSSNDQNVS
jgi:hypothetical protein